MHFNYTSLKVVVMTMFAILNFGAFAQTVQIGSGTTVTSTSGPSPVNNYYRSQHVQIVYSKGELNAAGITAGNIEKLGFYIASATSQALPDYKISLGHTTERDAWPYLNGPLQQVYHNSAYAPTAGGFDMLKLDTSWYWNGVDNIIVDVCFDYGYQPNISTGTVRTYTDSSYRISYNQSSVVDICGLSSSSSTTVKPQIQFEFTSPIADDAGIADVSPTGQTCGGSQAVSALLVNHGTNVLSSATVNWSVNGVVQTPVSFSGSLAAQGGTSSVALGNYNFVEGNSYTVAVWTTLPNGNADLNSDNDNLTVAVKAAMNGTYTIGGGGADYVSFTNAITDLESVGVCGDVVFNVATGGYFEQLEINDIPGAGPNATITFQSTSGDSSTVVLSHSAPNTAIYTLYVNGAQWVTFKNITIEATNNTYDRVILIGDESHHLSFENNIIRNAAPVTPYNYRNIEVESNANSDWLSFINNRIVEGYDGIYSPSSYADQFTITGNTFYSQQYGGIEIYYSNFVTVHDNVIITNDNNGVNGIYIYDVDSLVSVQRNSVTGGVSGNGINIQYCDGTSSQHFLIANNFVQIGSNANTSEGIYIVSGGYNDVVHNTVNVTYPSSNHRGIRINSGGNHQVLNNNVRAEGGTAYYVNNGNVIAQSDHNNWYTGGSTLAYWSGNTVSDLAALQSASGHDANSFAEPTYFLNDTSFQSAQVSLNNNGTPYAGVTTDIQGEARSGTNPDIGCDEFTPGSDDAGILSIVVPATPFAPGNLPVYAVVKNFGNNSLTSATIDWEIDGVAQSSVNFSGAIASGDTSSVLLGMINFQSGTIYNLKAYGSVPNGNADGNPLNDTANVGPFTPALGGTFTIGGTSPDFADFTAATEILNLGGTYDSTIFDVRSGTYTERIVIGAYPQLNMTDHVTFRSEAQDSSAVTITEGYLNPSTNYVVALQSASGVTFDKVTIENTSTNSYGTAVDIEYGSSYITFSECALVGGTTTSSASAALYARNTSGYQPQNHINVINCSLSGTYYGVYFVGGGGRDYNIRIEGCNISDFYGIGISIYYADSINVSGNTVVSRASASSSATGVYIYDVHQGNVSANQLITGNVRYGMELGYVDGYSGDPFIVSNNFIRAGGSASQGRGIYTYGSSYLNIAHNSVLNTNSQFNSIAYADHNTSSTNNVLNNIFQHTGGGFAIDKNSTGGGQTINHNNLFTTGAFLAMYGNTSVADLATWQSLSGHDMNSVSVNSQFVSNDDLHTKASSLDAAATPLAYVTLDIDGEARDPLTPDIGADEFVLTGSDAALIEFDYPKLAFPAGSQGVYVSLLNNGGDTLTSVTIDWEVNGVAQSTYNWTGNLFSSQVDDSVQIGSFNFVEDTLYTLRAWVSLPNGNADILGTNDTIVKTNLYAALAGTYTIGGTTPDFPNFSDAALALRQRGISDNVIFDVRDGVYNEEILIRDIAGVSPTDSVIFQSESGDSAAVVLQTGNTSSPTLILRGTDWITFKDMTIAHTYYWQGPNVIMLDSGVSHINILGCIVKDSAYSTVGDFLIIGQSGYPIHDIRIANSTFKNGRYGVYLQGASTSNRSNNTEIRNCVFENQYYEGIFTRYNNNLWITGNRISSYTGYASFDAIQLDQIVGEIRVSENQLLNITRYGLEFYSVTGTVAQRALVANNYIQLVGSNSGAIGAYLYVSQYLDFAHNSINSFATSPSSRGLYTYVNSYCNVVNNIFQCPGGGFPVEWLSNNNTYWDYNNLFTSGSIVGEYQNVGYANLAAWKAATGLDSNSLSIDAQFSDTTDFHIESGSLDGAGTAFAAVTTDLDGEGRDPVTPDMGADEFTLNTNDAALTLYVGPNKVFADGNQTVYVNLLNNGSDSLTSVQINWTVNGTPQTPLSWAGALATGQSEDSVAVGVFNFSPLTYHNLEVYTSLPNGLPDDLPINDTVRRNNLFPGLNGAYTLGGTTPDFIDFVAATQALHAGGIVGPVTINIRDGVYTEQVVINSIMGATSTDSVVFQSENGDAALVNLEFNGSNTSRYTILLNGSSNVGFKNITVSSLNVSYGYGAELIGSSNGVRFINCIFNSPASSSNYGIYSNNINQIGLEIIGCEFNRANAGIYVQGNYGTGFKVMNNTFNQQRTYGLFAYYFNEAIISGNHAVGATGFTSYSGMYLAYFRDGYEITKNTMHAPYGGHGMYLYDLDGTVSQRGLVANNFAVVGDSTANASSHEALWFQYGNYVDIFYNNTHHASTNGDAVFIGNISDVDVRNNIFAASNGGYALRSNSSPADFTALNYNAYFATGANMFYNSFGGINAVNNLNTWKGVMGLDANSIAADPLYVSSADLHVNQSALDSAATPVAQVVDDIDGELRDPSNPDIGADEISFLSGDIAITAITGVNSGCGLSDSVQFTIAIANNGTDPQTGFDITLVVDGDTVVETFAASVGSGSSANYTFAPYYDLSSIGAYNITAWSNLAGDVNLANDTLNRTINNFPPPIVSLTNDTTVCGGTSVQLTASGGTNFFWSTGVTGPSITVAPSATTTYTVTVTDANGCQAQDSVVVNISSQVDSIFVNAVTCDSTVADTVMNVYVNQGGCDSIVYTVYTYSPSYLVNLPDTTICEGESVNVFGNLISMAGTYYDTLSAAGGCDSVLAQTVWVNPSDTLTLPAKMICQGDSTVIFGNYQSSAGVYMNALTNQYGCDSIIICELIVNPNYNVLTNASICEGQSIFVGGAFQTMAGVYYDTLQTAMGCDSVLATNVSILLIDSTMSSVSLIDGDSLFVAGAYQKASGTYYETFTGSNGCDSVHATMVDFLSPARSLTYSGNTGFVNSIVSPLLGDAYTQFSFEAIFTDTNGILPPFGYPRVILDYEGNGVFNNPNDRTIIMTQADASDNDPTDGKLYTADISGLPVGLNWQSRIVVEEGGNTTVLGPQVAAPMVLTQPDLEIFANDITFSNSNPSVSSPLTINATVHNTSDYDAQNFVVHLVNQFDTTIVYPDIIVSNLPARSSTTVSWNITTPAVDAWCPMQVTVDYTNVIAETNELDNTALRPFTNGNFNIPGAINVIAKTSPSVLCSTPNTYVTVSGFAYYTGTAVPLTDSSVAGAQVEFTLGGATYTTVTNSLGNFSKSVPAPIPVGGYSVIGTVTDFTLTGTLGTSFQVQNCGCSLPDLITQTSVSATTIIAGQNVTGSFTVKNVGTAAAPASTLTLSQTGGTPTLGNQSTPGLAAGASWSYNFPAVTFNTPGTYSICATADGTFSISECSEGNAACVTIRVLPNLPDIIPVGGPTYTTYLCNTGNPSFSVRNAGGVATGQFVCKVDILHNGSPAGTYYHTIANIPPQQSTGFSIPFMYPATGGYSFTLSCDTNVATGGIVAEVSELNNVGVYSQSIVACMPDLVVSGCRALQVKPVDPQFPGTVDYELTIRNGGNATAVGPVPVRFTVSPGNVINTSYSGNIAPGQTVVVSASSPSVAPATATLTGTVDPLNVIAEFSETNNSQTDNLCWEFEPVAKCGQNFWQRSYLVNQTVYLSVGVEVEHLYEASSLDVQFEVSGPGISGTQNLGVATLTNVYENCACPWVAVLPTNFVFNQTGVYTFTMTVDPNNVYTECNEGNNVLVKTVTVGNAPDMRILSQFINPSLLNPEVNDTVDITVTYENIGHQNINDQMELKLMVNNVPIDSIKPVGGLVTGDNASFIFPMVWGSNIPGAHIIRAIIDSDNEIGEIDELNNEATRAIIVGDAANLYFQSLIASNPVPALLDTITLTTEVGNNGDVDAMADVKFSYIDNIGDTIPIGVVPISVLQHDSSTVQINWWVQDENTTIVAEIINTNTLEFLYTDNMTTTPIGGYAINIVAVDACYGASNGSLTATASGGVAPYQYTWSTGQPGPVLTGGPGNYTVEVVDANGVNVQAAGTIGIASGTFKQLPQVSICQGDSVLLFNTYRKVAGTYYDTIPGIGGCDTVCVVSLRYKRTNNITLPSVSICDGDSALVLGQYRSVAGWYVDSLTNTAGCDSIRSQQLIVKPVDTTYLNTTTNDPSQAGTFISKLYSSLGCDSTVITVVTYVPGGCTSVDSTTITTITCDSTLSGTTISTYTGTDGCDSVVTTITVYDPGSMMALPSKFICQGDSGLIFGEWQHIAGVYYDTLSNANGCDSILSCELIVNPVYNTSSAAEICQGDSLMIFGQWQSMAGIYIDTTQSINGCDSIHSTSLTVKPTVTVSVMDSICPGSGVVVGGGYQTTAGVYYDTLAAANGCDSIVITTLTIRTDAGCATPPASGDSLVIVTDNGWMKSTVTNIAEAGGYPWPGVSNLPALATYTLPAEIGQPRPWHSIDSVEGAHVFKSGNGVTFFRTTFSLTADTGVEAQIRSYMDDGMEIYINGHMIAREADRDASNMSGAQHHLKLLADGGQSNGHNGDQSFDVVNNYRMDSVVQVGMNELVIALRNAPQSNDKGGFSFRMDLKTGLSVPPQLIGYLVSDAEWKQSTITTPGGSSWNWPGVNSLPSSNTFTTPVEMGQPYSWYSTEEVPGSYAIKAEENITYYRRRFTLTDTSGIDVRLRTTFDENVMVFINDSLIAGHYQHGLSNRALPAHDVAYPNGGLFINGNAGGDPFMQVADVDFDQILRMGDNYITVALQNRSGDKGGFSLRLDMDKAGSPVIRKVEKVEATPQPVEESVLYFELYPNPTRDMVYIDLQKSPSTDNQVMLYDLNGKLLYQRTLVNPETGLMDLSLKEYPKGVYIIRISSGEHVHLGKRIVKF